MRRRRELHDGAWAARDDAREDTAAHDTGAGARDDAMMMFHKFAKKSTRDLCAILVLTGKAEEPQKSAARTISAMGPGSPLLADDSLMPLTQVVPGVAGEQVVVRLLRPNEWAKAQRTGSTEAQISS